MFPSASEQAAHRRGPHWTALLATALTWPLLFAGGLVTTYRVGMAVPDWPTTFGINMFLFDMSSQSWGVKVEHFHRLAGAGVGIFVILMLLDFLVFGRDQRIKTLGVAALVGVVAQGVLGGVRVRLNSTLLAAVHGCTGQLYFGYMVLLCVLTGRNRQAAPVAIQDARRQRFRAGWTLALVYVQIVAGAWLRHYPSEVGLWLHAVLAAAVAAHVLAIVVRTERRREELAALVPSSRCMAAALVFQAILGIGAWWLLRPFDGIPRHVTSIQALIRTGHQANAALLLAATVVHAAGTWLRFVPDSALKSEAEPAPSVPRREALA